MSALTLIARDELWLMRRSRVSVIAAALLIVLVVIAGITSVAHQSNVADTRARLQAQVDEEFDNQPSRHPHRMVHFGHFIFRPLPPLAAFDPGIDAFTGNAMFLEGHRQNSANFGDVRQSSILVRFGQLTPAFVLQTLAPLLIIFLGYGAVARERGAGTLRQLFMQGVSAGTLIAGKLLALAKVAALIAIPAMSVLIFVAAQPGAAAGPIALTAAGYLTYLALWSIIVVLVSASVARPRNALLALLGLWSVTVILLPRIAPDLAATAVPQPTRLETDLTLQRELRAMGDSHNPDDPVFAAFKQRVLRQYGVRRVEDLPVNYKGLLAVEGERMTSELFDRYASEGFARQARQSATMDAIGTLSPAVAMRRLSMAAAGTDLAGHARFLDQAEAYRYDLVQRLNRLQADAVSFEDDAAKSSDTAAEQRSRIDPHHWHAMPDFHFAPPEPGDLVRRASPAAVMLLLWLLVPALLLAPAARRLEGVRS